MRPSDDALHLLEVHAREYGIVLWNEKTNLTGLRTPERILVELFLDSLIPAPHISAEGSLLDAGSGAGAPGLPLKILYPKLRVHLLESRAKRVSFLNEAVRLLGLTGIEVIRGRIERDASLLPLNCYPLITARALAPFSRTVSLCSALLCAEGLLICYLGEHVRDLIEESLPVLDKEAMEVQEIIPYSLPGRKGQRNVVMLRKK